MFVLVRHAHAGNKRKWPGPDLQRPLTERGQRQAAALATSLYGLEIRTVLTSPATRCRQTVAPLAEARHLQIHDHDLLLPDADVTALLTLLAQPALAAAVLCTHRETLTRLLPHWQDSMPTDSPPGNRTAKGAAWVITNYPGPEQMLRYIPAVPA